MRSKFIGSVAAVWYGTTEDMTEMRTRRKRDPDRTREAILEAAREVLAQDGKEGVSVVQVARRAGARLSPLCDERNAISNHD